MQKMKILIVEDEEGIRDALSLILSEKFDIEFAVNGIDGIKKAVRVMPDIILLDLKMPVMDGFQTCKVLREDPEFNNTPIIILSAFNSTADRVRSFELGADDYISKPFDRKELIARIQRKIQGRSSQSNANNSPSVLTVEGILKMDMKSQQLTIENTFISLSGLEFKLLHLLATHYSELVTRETIIEYVWEKQAVSPRLIDPHVLSLRNKINEHNFTIQSIYGKGYVLKKLNN